MKTLIASLMVALIGGFSYANLHDHSMCNGFIPENDMKIPVGTIFASGGGITEAQFNEVLDRIDRIYTPILEAQGKKLDIARLWSNDTVNASAQQFGNTWRINMYGGLARHPAIGVEAFATVACHEMGHHLGGAPKYGWGNGWASNEGQSDYFATLKCMRKLYSSDENIEYAKNIELDEYAKSLCENTYDVEGETADRLTNCYRSSIAGEHIAVLFQMLRKMDTKPEFSTPDDSTVNRTNDRHPMPQCRLDTYFNGALCNIADDIDVSQTDATVGVCNRAPSAESPEDIGMRPLCWYKPTRVNIPSIITQLNEVTDELF